MIKKFISSDKVRFFSLARYALADSLRIAGVSVGDSVLIPEYICKDIIASIKLNNAEVVFYKVDSNLSPKESPDKWPKAKVVLAVNYFGFPQNLCPFRCYSKLNGAIIIEDNAHGFLSKDNDGNWLGLRTSIGIFSFRKTFCFPDGAALIINDSKIQHMLDKQVPFTGSGYSTSIEIKCKIKKIPFIGIYLWMFIVWFVRFWRKIKTGHPLPLAVDVQQYEIPYSTNPYKNLISRIKSVANNGNSEIERRIDLYQKVSRIAFSKRVFPIFESLPDGVVPYGFPFRALENDALLFGERAKWLGLDLMKWPDLPNNIIEQEYYNNVWVINFL